MTSALDFGGNGLAKGVRYTAGNSTGEPKEYSVSLANGIILEAVLTFVLVISVLTTSSKSGEGN